MQTFQTFLSSLRDLFDQINLDQFTEPTYTIVLAFAPAILGISYPLIIQTIGRLDNQYESSHIVNLFQKEWLHKWFLRVLVASVMLAVAGFLLQPILAVLAFVSVVSLLVVFFCYLKLLLVYQNAEKLFEHIMKKVGIGAAVLSNAPASVINKTRNNVDAYWHPATDLLIYAIKKENRKLEDDIRLKFLYPAIAFMENEPSSKMNEVSFPNKIYNTIHQIVLYSVRHANPHIYKPIEQYVTLYFPTSSRGKKKINYIHTVTWQYLWKSLSVLMESNRGDKIIAYWERAHQHYLYHFSRLAHARMKTEFNQEVHNKQRKRFYQFHVALGAYLYHKSDYKTLKNIWSYSHAEPPEYVLLPQTMDGVFDLYFGFVDPRLSNTEYTIEYWFQDLPFEHMNFHRDAKTVIREYCCLLYLRQWIIAPYYRIDPLTHPETPECQHVRQTWETNLPIIKGLVKKHLADQKLLTSLGLHKLTDDSSISEKQKCPLAYLDDILLVTKEKKEVQLRVDQLSDDKLDKLKKYTLEAIRDVYNDFKRVADNEIGENDRDSLSNKKPYFGGFRMLMPKEALVNNQSMAYLNYEKVLGESVVHEYAHNILGKLFYYSENNTYLVQYGKLFEAIDRLKLKPGGHIIISLGLFLKQYHRSNTLLKKAESETAADYMYNGIPVYSFNYAIPPQQAGLYVIPLHDRPMLKHHRWKDLDRINSEIKKYWESFNSPIDEELQIYFKATDFESNDSLNEKDTNQNTQQKVELTLNFLASCWFRKTPNIVFLKEGDPGQEGEVVQSISNIKSL